ncbi:lipopolysaccharide heptosyltransferase II [Candidatus Thioglobus autotrophicus]|uniref:lipopolysaccharide heptosyltransferase II n=1 Tax=Candidatus Thioglobus autotrophicus TaxID=1705394 RepID=UPI00384A4A4F
MATPAIENIVNLHPNVDITIFGSAISTRVFEYHPNVQRIVIDGSRKQKFRVFHLYKQARQLGRFDCAISFRRTLASKLFVWFCEATLKGNYRRYTKRAIHQVIRYNDFVNKVFKVKVSASQLTIYKNQKPVNTHKSDKKLLGINPGASYGSAKRWYPEEFAKVAGELSGQYDIVIFGGPGETDIASDIEKSLIENGITNYQNLAGKTSITALIENISNLDLFITGDSGPMHVAAAFQVPTVAIFGPTKDDETSQWMNDKSVIVKKNLKCQPCMKRTCPLQHHDCMKLITAVEVLDAVKRLN